MALTVTAGAMARWHGRPAVALVSERHVVELYDIASARLLERPVDVAGTKGAVEGEPLGAALLVARGRPAVVVLTGRSLGDSFTVAVWDLVDGSLLARLEPAVSPAVTTCVVNGQPTVITVGEQGVLRVWDVLAERPLRTVQTGQKRIRFVATGLRQGRPVVLSAGYDGPVGVWDLVTGAAVDEIRLPDTCRGIALGEGGTLVIGIQNDIAVLETEIQGVVPELGKPR